MAKLVWLAALVTVLAAALCGCSKSDSGPKNTGGTTGQPGASKGGLNASGAQPGRIPGDNIQWGGKLKGGGSK